MKLTIQSVSQVLAAVTVLGTCNTGHAATVSVPFAGFVLSMSDDGGHLAGHIAPGTTLHGTWRYDSTTPDLDPDPHVGEYQQTDPAHVLQATFGTVPVQSQSLLMQILDDATIGIGTLDRYGAIGMDLTSYTAGSKTILLDQFHVFLTDSTLTAHSSDALPLAPPDTFIYDPCVGGFAQGQLIGRESISNDLVFVNFCVRTIVPEPAGLATTSLGLIGLWLGALRSSIFPRCKRGA